MKDRRAKAILSHILLDLIDIRAFTKEVTREQFDSSSLIKKAVCMSLINVGELSRELTDEVKARYPAIPWASIVGLRNRAAHGYHALDPDIIWTIINGELEPLEAAVRLELLSFTHN
ncbi:MAG: DUF86 domain-containing protein [Thermaerobacter sp.]|nr:DUF86 domain-containing protein [Thermaerobacter sp.]